MWQRLKRWLFPKITQYRLKPRTLEAMAAMAQSTHPKEAFAVLEGRHEKDTLVVESLAYQPFTNTKNSAHVQLDVYAIRNMVGTFHSHPGYNAKPSSADKRMWIKHPGVHCIMAYPYLQVHVFNQYGQLLGVHSRVARQAARKRQK